MTCPLCASPEVSVLHEGRTRTFLACDACDLAFVPPEQHASVADERARYLLHRNHPGDPGYRRFLERLVQPLVPRLPPGAVGLDFGCGPSPVLSGMLSDLGFAMSHYDPLFHPDAETLRRTYDFVTCTEVLEHLRQPRRELALLADLVRPGGVLAVMTSLRDTVGDFGAWHYQRDPTHVAFWGRKTICHVAGWLDLEMVLGPGDVTVLRKLVSSGARGRPCLPST